MEQHGYAKPYTNKTYPEFEYISPIQPHERENNTWPIINQQAPTVQEVAEKRKYEPSSKAKNKKHTSRTMSWLDENYLISEGICLPRCILYSHYLDFCKNECLEPACAATFGKMIRQKFPKITTRRLGTRGHSKYHYYGIGIRETSPYYHSVYSSKGLTRFSTNSIAENTKFEIARTGHIRLDVDSLTEYPDISKVNLSSSFGFDKYHTDDLLFRHKTHCQEIVKSLQEKNFPKVQSLIVSFWQKIPQSYYVLLENEIIIDVICLGDSVLYKKLTDILIPVTSRNLEESVLDEMRYIAKNWEEWEMTSLAGISQTLAKKKLTLSHQFAQSVKRQSTFLHLAKNINGILTDSSKVTSMINDISRVDLGSIGSQAFYATTESEGQDNELNAELLKDLKDLLQRYAPLDQYISWLDSIIERKVIKPSKQNGRSTKKRAQDFLLKWSFFGARIMHNLTLNNAVSFGSFHVLRMLFDEYILFGVETQFNNEKDQELATMVEKHLKRQAKINMQHYCNLNSSPLKRKYSPTETQSFATTIDDNFQGRPTVINRGFSSSTTSPFPNPQPMPGFFTHIQPPAPRHTAYISHPFSTAMFQNQKSDISSQINHVTNCATSSVMSYSASVSKPSPNSYVCVGDQIYTSLESYPTSDSFATCWNTSDDILMQPQHTSGPSNFSAVCDSFTTQQSAELMYQYVPVISSPRNGITQDKRMMEIGYTTCSTSSEPITGNALENRKLVEPGFQDTLLQFPNNELESAESCSSDLSLLECCQKYEDPATSSSFTEKPEFVANVSTDSSFLTNEIELAATKNQKQYRVV